MACILYNMGPSRPCGAVDDDVTFPRLPYTYIRVSRLTLIY